MQQNIKILDVQWINDTGIVTIDNGYEVKSYIKKVDGFDEQKDIEDIIHFGSKLYPVQLERILSFYKGSEKR